MTYKKTNSIEYITQVEAVSAGVTIKTMSMTGTARTENTGPRMSLSIMKQPTFNWSSKELQKRGKMLQNLNQNQKKD